MELNQISHFISQRQAHIQRIGLSPRVTDKDQGFVDKCNSCYLSLGAGTTRLVPEPENYSPVEDFARTTAALD